MLSLPSPTMKPTKATYQIWVNSKKTVEVTIAREVDADGDAFVNVYVTGPVKVQGKVLSFDVRQVEAEDSFVWEESLELLVDIWGARKGKPEIPACTNSDIRDFVDEITRFA